MGPPRAAELHRPASDVYPRQTKAGQCATERVRVLLVEGVKYSAPAGEVDIQELLPELVRQGSLQVLREGVRKPFLEAYIRRTEHVSQVRWKQLWLRRPASY